MSKNYVEVDGKVYVTSISETAKDVALYKLIAERTATIARDEIWLQKLKADIRLADLQKYINIYNIDTSTSLNLDYIDDYNDHDDGLDLYDGDYDVDEEISELVFNCVVLFHFNNEEPTQEEFESWKEENPDEWEHIYNAAKAWVLR